MARADSITAANWKDVEGILKSFRLLITPTCRGEGETRLQSFSKRWQQLHLSQRGHGVDDEGRGPVIRS